MLILKNYTKESGKAKKSKKRERFIEENRTSRFLILYRKNFTN